MEKGIAALLALADKADQYKNLQLTARSQTVPAQLTTLGKRMANWGEELERALDSLSRLCATYPYRGLKGAVGTRLDQITLLGDASKAEQLDQKVMAHLGAPANWESVGQVYPRSLDFEVVSVLVRLSAAPASFAKTLRIMAGHELLGEGFAKGQTGSSAMPHKMNSRSCERINGFQAILNGHLAMVSALSGDQWNEGAFPVRWSGGSLYPMRFRLGRLARYLPDGALSNGGFPRRDQGRVPPVSPLFVVDHFHDGGGQGRIREGRRSCGDQRACFGDRERSAGWKNQGERSSGPIGQGQADRTERSSDWRPDKERRKKGGCGRDPSGSIRRAGENLGRALSRFKGVYPANYTLGSLSASLSSSLFGFCDCHLRGSSVGWAFFRYLNFKLWQRN